MRRTVLWVVSGLENCNKVNRNILNTYYEGGNKHRISFFNTTPFPKVPKRKLHPTSYSIGKSSITNVENY